MSLTATIAAKPFLKWAGGKSQLLSQIETHLPQPLRDGQMTKYAEPFAGGGAVFFYLARHYPIRRFFISDLNRNLVLAYRTIQADVEYLIERLAEIEQAYHAKAGTARETYFYEMRTAFNEGRDWVDCNVVDETAVSHTARLIFLNRTCYNGLYRVNRKGVFNVPFGRYKRPRICDARNLRAVAALLADTEIEHGDFSACRYFVDDKTFVYFDPPYRPISKTAVFTSYAKDGFNDEDQQRLARFYADLDAAGASLMLSSSDPQNEDPDDDFFETLYDGFNIHKVQARRNINSKTSKRGTINELLITNYPTITGV